ncbi:hypothetical protein SEA_FORZA_42 [Gordonia phage Forza]|uniref:Lipoprotein n=1 Tax=Gordonia phage Forza TaxID=2571247 RepID=A0A650EZC9_9CAUD|nr:hypothetical protein PP303_gp042 [Gordonia phage Forza]QEM41512.1 hypothetical protein SEA_BOOPY_43 [Gordonia phage Boopy]QGT55035.1 hypothetical protein SEA_FORZA_42 [Gordonia phage Forza]UXE04185.1 hypothetical protein SEA_BLUENGOLD_41 [Gordonia phage BlueNGold]WBF03824.1 hypothetical protein SEA_MAREELIH_41 [Gordonia phage Mareelih]
MKTALGIAFATVIALTGCSAGLKSGEIIEKKYNPESGYFTQVNNVQIWNSVPEKWEFRLRDCETRDDDGDCRTSWLEVSEDTYDDYKVGDDYE